ncbi:hypothetical protein GSI_14234 [Ganoderma sinense ZZ0214-1]|uniref:Uncharacterized protein n=1 Tax=Ganoderma sinense ZZ0214-1 TaxID=1077348 RepID=A0A2G8RSJ4_9APHY|nr:hypothetical protein GSI_14234 [Ganoderma sinense ZZ0214-1]
MHILDQYKVPRESVDIEALVQRMAWYFKVAAEDTQFLHKHPARRDELFAELYKHPDVKPSVAANQFVPLGRDPDTHLIPADAEIERLTPPKTIEDRVARLHIAWAALMVYNKYKVRYPLLNHSDLGLQVDRRTTQIMDEWRDGEFVHMFPEHAARRAALQGPSIPTPPTQARLPTAPPARSSDPGPVGAPKRVSDDIRKNPKHYSAIFTNNSSD